MFVVILSLTECGHFFQSIYHLEVCRIDIRLLLDGKDECLDNRKSGFQLPSFFYAG